MPHFFSGPKRIVCLTEETTETLYRLGCEDRIVGISTYTVRPSVAKKQKPVVSAFIDGSVAKIKALKPDLVIGFSDIQAQLAQKLIAAHQNVLVFNQRSVAEILDVIGQTAQLVGRAEAGQRLIDQCTENLERIQASAKCFGQRPRVYFEEWDEPTITAIQWVSELVEIAGGDNIFKDLAQGKGASERFVSKAQIADKNPEIIFASWCGKPFVRSAFDARFDKMEIRALHNNHVYEIPSELILQPGPAALLEGVNLLHQHLLKLGSSNLTSRFGVESR